MTILLLLICAVTVTSCGEITSDTAMCSLPPLVASGMPKDTLHVITGNLLGDGCLRRTGRKKDGKPTGNARFEMNKAVVAHDKALSTFNNYYKPYSGKGFRRNTYFSGSLGHEVTQYHIFTRSLPLLTSLHALWYVWDPLQMKYVKVVPDNISEMFSPLSLAHWIMDDGYYTDATIILCTDNFTKAECQILQALLLEYSIQSGLIIQKGKYRIRLYRSSVRTVIQLVEQHMHKDFMYKLGL